MTIRLPNVLAVLMALLMIIGLGHAFAGMVAVDDEELAEIEARTGINLEGRLRATAGNLIMSGTAGGLKLGEWFLNNTPANPFSGSDPAGGTGFSSWGPFTLDVGYISGANPRSVLRLGLADSGTVDNPTWIFKNVQMWVDENYSDLSVGHAAASHDIDFATTNPFTDWVSRDGVPGATGEDANNPTDNGWVTIFGLYLQQIHLSETYINLFNDGARSDSQIQAFGQFKGLVHRATIDWGTQFGTNGTHQYATVENLEIYNHKVAGVPSGFLELGGDAGSSAPFVWDSTSTFDGTDFNTRIFFPINGSLRFTNVRLGNPQKFEGATPSDARANPQNFGYLEIDHWIGEVTIDLPQKLTPTTGIDRFWNY